MVQVNDTTFDPSLEGTITKYLKKCTHADISPPFSIFWACAVAEGYLYE